MTREEYYNLLCEKNSFYYWDKESDVIGKMFELRPSFIAKHRKVVAGADELINAYQATTYKDEETRKRAESILAFANEEKRKSQEILKTEEASIQQYLGMEKPVLVVSDGECMEIVDISEYEEIQGMSDEEALLWYRQMRISKAMESFIKSDFYGDDFGLMCLRMREEIKALYEWIAEAKKKYPELPDVPDYEDDDEQVDRLYEKAVLCGSLEVEKIKEKRKEKVMEKIQTLKNSKYLTEKTEKKILKKSEKKEDLGQDFKKK